MCHSQLLHGNPLATLIVAFLLICTPSSGNGAEPQDTGANKAETDTGSSSRDDDTPSKKKPTLEVYSTDIRSRADAHALSFRAYRMVIEYGIYDEEDRERFFEATSMMALAPTVPNIQCLAHKIDYYNPVRAMSHLAWRKQQGGKTQFHYPCVQSLCRMGEPTVSTLIDHLVAVDEMTNKQVELLAYCLLEIRDHGIDGKATGLLEEGERERLLQSVDDAATRSKLSEAELTPRLELAKYFLTEIDLGNYGSRTPRKAVKPIPARSAIYPSKEHAQQLE
ncbi:hypothetical protein [Aeoliella sp.]|uniref:hypothetical protein n=1 Tax=Aeoliella sp. TaxID=2795800 RepID=UPI003CCC1E7B